MDPLYDSGVSSTYFYLTDNLGSLLAVFNNVTSNAALLSTQLYAPYGSARYGAGPQLSTYTGKGYTEIQPLKCRVMEDLRLRYLRVWAGFWILLTCLRRTLCRHLRRANETGIVR